MKKTRLKTLDLIITIIYIFFGIYLLTPQTPKPIWFICIALSFYIAGFINSIYCTFIKGE